MQKEGGEKDGVKKNGRDELPLVETAMLDDKDDHRFDDKADADRVDAKISWSMDVFARSIKGEEEPNKDIH